MSRCVRLMAVAVCLQLFAAPAAAQQLDANGHFERALEAKERGDFDAALQYLEKAQLANPRPQFIYHRIMVLEAMGEAELALDVLDEHRKHLAGAEGVDELAVLEQRLEDRAHEQNEARTSAGEAKVLGWSLVGGGAVLVAGGLASLWIGEREVEKLRCSPLSSADKAGCSGVEAHTELTQAEFESKRRDVTLYRAVGAGLSAVGLATIGWGLYRLLDSENPRQMTTFDDEPRLRAVVSADGRLGVELHCRF